VLPNWTYEQFITLRDALAGTLGEPTNLRHSIRRSQDSRGSETKAEMMMGWEQPIEGQAHLCGLLWFEASFEQNCYSTFVHAKVGRREMSTSVTKQLFNLAGKFEEGQAQPPDTLEEWAAAVREQVPLLAVELREKQAKEKAAEAARKAEEAARPNLANLCANCDFRAVLKEVSYDSGDKRSCGNVTVKADTSEGELEISVTFGSSGSHEADDWSVTLNGKEVNVDGMDSCVPDFGAPHYYQGSKLCDKWEAEQEQTCQEALDEWLCYGEGEDEDDED
jgi:hypothetical protein